MRPLCFAKSCRRISTENLSGFPGRVGRHFIPDTSRIAGAIKAHLPRGGTFWDVGANVAKVKGKFAPHAALMLRHPTGSNMTLNRQQEKREDNPSRLDPIACRVLLVIGGGAITGTLVFVLTASTFDSCSIERGSRATWPPLHGAVRHCAVPTATPSSLRARSQSS